MASQRYTWVVLNQSQSPSFQKLIARLAESLGPCLLLTGMPHPNASPHLHVEAGPAYQRQSTRSRLRSWTLFMAFAAKRVALISGKPFVLSVTNPPMLPHLGLSLARLKGWRTGILVWDLYPEHIVEQGWLSARNPIVRAWALGNRLAYKRANAIIALGDGMAGAIAHQARQELAIAVIPNWADTSWLKPIEKHANPFAQTHCTLDAITVLYSGNLGASHSLDALLLAAKELADLPRLEFLIIGEGLRTQEIKMQAEALGLRNLKLLPYQPWDQIPYSLSVGDIAVVSQEKGTEHLSVPSKTYSALAVGSAILALTQKGSDLANLVEDHQVGVVCQASDATQIASAIRSFVEKPEALRQCQQRARVAATTHYSEDAVFSQFKKVLSPHV